ncbi:GNAT family N-acetyltransferase [Micromonospora sp. ATA32]|nr:GNAT family N-acetyltransferase [Micromonospora sp. ATA32]
MQADVDPGNRASVRVLEKTGLRLAGTDERSERAEGRLHRYVLTAAELSAR